MGNGRRMIDSIKNTTGGYTLIELVLVILVLGILAATVLPRFFAFAKDARVEALKQIEVSVKIANDFMFLKSKMPSYTSVPVANRDDLIDVDLDGETIRLKWFYLDNTDIEKRIDISDDFSIQYQGIAHTYIGYDRSDGGVVRDDNCYFKYTQASSATTPPKYEIVDSGC